MRLQSPRVVCVDDNQALLENLSEILGEAGYEVLTATNSKQAEQVAKKGFEVALVDCRLPDGDGTMLAARLKEEHPESAVVVLTGYATVETAAAAVRAGAFAYLVKPCATPELLLTLEQALRDVRLRTEKRELAQRAQVAEKLAAVGTMTAGLSHEIRNPLNAAALQLAIAERRVEKLPEQSREAILEPLRVVREEIRRLDHILQDFLQFARPREVARNPVDLVALASKVLDFLAGEAEKRRVKLERALRGPITVTGDEGQLRQVLMNLMLNALDATPSGGKVTLSTGSDDETAIVEVQDTGPGIPEAVRQRIFEPFFTTKASGSGLGLPIVHGIVAQHSGTITIDETPGSSGTRVVVRLPRRVAAVPVHS